MNGLPYYKAYPRDFLEGTAGWPLELKGAYRVLLDLIYLQAGKLPDDARYISGQLGVSVRKWNVIRKQLIAYGKIYAQNGIISNKRADDELIIISKYRDNQAENRSRPNKNKDLQSPPRPLISDICYLPYHKEDLYKEKDGKGEDGADGDLSNGVEGPF